MSAPKSIEQTLHEIYYSPDSGFLSADKIHRKAKLINPLIKLKDVTKFINDQYTAQVNKQVLRKKIYNSIYSSGPGQNYQMDIMVYDRYQFHNYKYILVVVDVYSRYAMAKAMTNRNNPTILQNIKEIFDTMGVPKSLNCDNEFDTKEFKKYVQKNNITMYYSQPNEINKNAIVERINRTIAQMLQRWRVGSKRYDWYKVLPNIMNNYNTSYHRTIKATPSDVFNRKELNHQKIIILKSTFKVGDQVRTVEVKNVFDKGDKITHSKEVYLIVDKIKHKFQLADQEGEVLPRLYKDYELSKAANVQYYNPEKEPISIIDDELEHKANQKIRRVKKLMNKEGVEQNVSTRTLRQRVPTSQLEHALYGNIKY